MVIKKTNKQKIGKKGKEVPERSYLGGGGTA